MIDKNLSQEIGLRRLGIHHVILKPGERSSLPHAESLEEEFVYVLRGEPHAWIDGWIYGLKPGHACGFKAGTGIGHSFINNSKEDIELLVLGEKTKPENRCAYLVDPEEHQKLPIRWDDCPRPWDKEMGPHSGKPGTEEAFELGIITEGFPEFIVHAPSLPLEIPFHYPGDNETFGLGPRLTKKIGLEKLGISFEVVAPGRRTSFPHAHSIEEEFVFVISGQASVWLNGHIKELNPGEWVGFSPDQKIAHCIINNSNQPLSLLVIGEASEFPGEQIAYPQNPLRNKECDRINWFWREFKMKNPGAHPGRPDRHFPGHLRFHLTTEDHCEQVLSIFEKAPTYFLNVEGKVPSLKTAHHAVVDGPEKRSSDYYKEFLLVEYEGERIGVLDLHFNHPGTGIAYLGLLLVEERFQRRGLGSKIYELCEDYCKKAHETKVLRLGINTENDVTQFWTRFGFRANGRSYQWQGEGKVTQVLEFEKNLK